jgi:hypothetical protein
MKKDNQVKSKQSNTLVDDKFIPPTIDEVRDMVIRKSYEDIYIQTEATCWEDVYSDTGINKGEFIPKLYFNWKMFWEDKIIKHKNNKDYIIQERDDSWKDLQVLIAMYDFIDSPLEFALEVDDINLHPICVVTMLEIFDLETCLEEYMEYMEDIEY